jgi:hypothetical protein
MFRAKGRRWWIRGTAVFITLILLAAAVPVRALQIFRPEDPDSDYYYAFCDQRQYDLAWGDGYARCNIAGGTVSAWAIAFLGTCSTEAMQAVFINLESPRVVTVEATIHRTGGTQGFGLAQFAGTYKTAEFGNPGDSDHHYARWELDRWLTWTIALDKILGIVGLAAGAYLPTGTSITAAIDMLSTVNDAAMIGYSFHQFMQDSDSNVDIITVREDHYMSVVGQRTIRVGLRSQATGVGGTSQATNIGYIEQIVVHGVDPPGLPVITAETEWVPGPTVPCGIAIARGVLNTASTIQEPTSSRCGRSRRTGWSAR